MIIGRKKSVRESPLIWHELLIYLYIMGNISTEKHKNLIIVFPKKENEHSRRAGLRL
jgi:hypothetical protein